MRDPGKRCLKIGPELREGPFDACLAADQHMIGARNTGRGQNLGCKRTKSALHAIPHHRPANLARNGDSKPDCGIAIVTTTDEQDETRRGCACAAVCSQEIGAAPKPRQLRTAQADSVLRPRARRAASTLRPPTVALRARKP